MTEFSSSTTGSGDGDSAARRTLPAARVGFALSLVLLAAVLVIAARSEPPRTGDRLGRRVELVELIRTEQGRADILSQRVDELASQVEAFQESDSTTPDVVTALQEQVDAVAAAAGLTAVRGPGVEVVLRDSVLGDSPSGDINDLVIHEQDLQAVINALWAGGAEAMSVNGQRVLATTAIRCVGNTLLLHGSVYSPPYVIRAIGDAVEIRAALDRDPSVERFRSSVTQFQLGFDIGDVEELEIPAYTGVSAMQIATPVAGADG